MEWFNLLCVLIDYFNWCFVNVTKQFIEICGGLPTCLFVNSFSPRWVYVCAHNWLLINRIRCLIPITCKLYNRCKNWEWTSTLCTNECKKKHGQSVDVQFGIRMEFILWCVRVWVIKITIQREAIRFKSNHNFGRYNFFGRKLNCSTNKKQHSSNNKTVRYNYHHFNGSSKSLSFSLPPALHLWFTKVSIQRKKFDPQ